MDLIHAARSLSAAILALLAAMALAAAGPARAGAEEYRLVVTGGQFPLYPVMTDEPPVEDPAAAYEEGLRSLRDEHPDAFFVEAGGFASFDAVLETGYNSRTLLFFDEMDYSAVRLNARDAALTVVGSAGLHYAPGSVRDRVISNMDLEADNALGFPAHRLAENPGGQRMHFQSLASFRTAQGLGDRLPLLVPEGWEALRGQLRSAVEDAPAPVAAFGEMTEEEWAEFAGEEDGAPAHVYFDGTMAPDEDPVRQGGVWRMPMPALGEAHVVTFRFREAELDGEPRLERVALVPGLRREDLYKFPVPRAGIAITNLESVVAQFFAVSADSVRQDRVDAEGLGHLTLTEHPIVYHFDTEEGTRRVYRIMSLVPNYHRPGYYAPGWPESHILVVLDGEHQLDRVVSRLRFPIAGLDTTLLEALQRLPGTPEDEWRPDTELAAGMEEAWEWIVTDIRRVMELDRELYGPGGLYHLPDEE